MKNKIYLGLLGTLILIWSCDEPEPFGDSTFVYNPFTFEQDTLHNVTEITHGQDDVEWGSHLRAWVGETMYYKSGFSVDFTFPDSTLDIALADSIKFHLRHAASFAEAGQDSIAKQYYDFGFYNTTDQAIDVSSSAYGLLLGIDTMDVKGGNTYWSHIIPDGNIAGGDTSISLGIFPEETGLMSVMYGGGSSIRPSLVFYFVEPDSAGDDSVTTVTFLSDTLFMYLEAQTSAFDTAQYHYLSQLTNDSLTFSLDLADLLPTGDTLVHVATSSFLPEVIYGASSMYESGTVDSLVSYYLTALDPVTGLSTGIVFGEDNLDVSNEVNFLIQTALDDDRSELDLVIKSNHVGYDPGFIAISKDILQSAIYVNTAQVVQP